MRKSLDEYKKSKVVFSKRATAAFIFVILTFLIIILRLIFLQIIQHERYKNLSKNNRVNIIPLVPTRGQIYDRSGMLVATNLPAYQIDITPEKTKNVKDTVDKLKQLIEITQTEEETFYKTIKYNQKFKPIPIRFNLNEEEVAKFAVNRHLFPEIDIKTNFIRYYPFKEPLAHTIGYVGRISDTDIESIDVNNYRATHFIGKIGVERFYESTLHGKIGFQEVEINAKGRIVRTLFEEPPIPGNDIYLSIDTELQSYAYELLENKRGSIVAIEPETGEILALVSKPAYNPNLFTTGISRANFDLLNHSKDQPLLNRAIRGIYPPASIIKPFIALQALHKNIVDSEYSIYDKGYFQFKNHTHKYRDWKPYGHGWINIDSAIYESCDTFFYQLSNNLGIDNIQEILENFAFGSKTNIDLYEESTGFVPSREWKKNVKNQSWFPGETLITSIGQGYLTSTPLQLAYATALLANKGSNSPKPHLIVKQKSYEDKEKVYQQTNNPNTIKLNEIKKEHWDKIIESMQKTVSHPKGTAHAINSKKNILLQLKQEQPSYLQLNKMKNMTIIILKKN
tara:strand:+ start:43225 stop:44925 length:1701 start_codon:yes stop_codon:yes gene_type:complete